MVSIAVIIIIKIIDAYFVVIVLLARYFKILN